MCSPRNLKLFTFSLWSRQESALSAVSWSPQAFIIITPFSPQFRGIQLLVVTILSHRYNSRTGSGETKVESHASSETQPNQAALLLNTACIQPGSQQHQCVGENTVHLATWLACTAPGPPQESLVRDETRTSLPTKPSLHPDETRPIVCRRMDLPVAAACDRAWAQTQSLWWHS